MKSEPGWDDRDLFVSPPCGEVAAEVGFAILVPRSPRPQIFATKYGRA